MATGRGIPEHAIFRLPGWLGGGKPTEFLAGCDLIAEPIAESDNLWRLQTNESRRGLSPNLVSVDHLVLPGSTWTRLDRLTYAARAEIPSTVQIDPNEILSRELRAQRTGLPVDAFNIWRLKTMTAPPGALADVVRDAYNGLRSIGRESDSDAKVFANSGVHLIKRSPHIIRRSKFSSVGLRVAYDPDLGEGNTEHLQVATAAGETVFASSEGLYEGVYTFDSYTGPLLGALTPFIWAFAAHRGCGVVLYSLGCTLVGTASDASEMLQLLSQPGPEERVKRPELSTTAATQAIEWWTQRLNTMFGILTDPAVFTDSHGLYQPAKHLRALLTIEQLFRRVYSIQTTHRDASARRVLLFTVLDTLHSLTNHALVKNCDPDFAKETLEWLRLQIPGPAAEILLPAAERAVAALERIRDGFFLGVTPDGNRIRLMHPQGDAEEITLSQASARYVELLRNATHGHGTIKANQVDNINALLAQHRGHLPHDLALVGYLYLLEALTRPDILRKNLYRNGKA